MYKNNNLRKIVKMTSKNLSKVREAAVVNLFWNLTCKLETRAIEDDQAGLYKHLKTMDLEGKRDRGSACTKDKDGILLRRGVELIRELWSRWFLG